MTIDRVYHDKNWLEKQYNLKHLSTVRMAEMAGCTVSTIQYWMTKHKIVRRSLSDARKEAQSRGDLERVFIKTKMYHGEGWLREQYLEQYLTVGQVAEKAGCSTTTICRWLEKYGIATRSKSQTLAERWARGDFDGMHSDDDWKRKQSETRKRLWREGVYDDPVIREKQSKASKVMWAAGCCDHIFTAEYCRNASEKVKAAWERGDFDGSRQKMALGVKDAWARGAYKDRFTPEVRQRMAQAKRKAWADGLYDQRDIGGEKHPRWQGGISFEPYPSTFDEKFKRLIRGRDSYTCAVCRFPGKCVHHINYVKDDTQPENCVTLCRPCHGATGGNRPYWQATLTQIMQARSSFVEVA